MSLCAHGRRIPYRLISSFWRGSIGTLDLVRQFSGCIEIAGYALSLFPSPFRAGGKELFMSTPYVKEFDYDLWTTEDGRCWAKIRSTGETTEISKEVMRLLRREEKALYRRKLKPSESDGENAKRAHSIAHPLSLEAQESNAETFGESTWLISSTDLEETFLATETERLLIQSLTARQKDCYFCCIVRGESKIDYAKRTGISVQRVSQIIVHIQQKLKKLI